MQDYTYWKYHSTIILFYFKNKVNLELKKL
jgi:hypothetical protein